MTRKARLNLLDWTPACAGETGKDLKLSYPMTLFIRVSISHCFEFDKRCEFGSWIPSRFAPRMTPRMIMRESGFDIAKQPNCQSKHLNCHPKLDLGPTL